MRFYLVFVFLSIVLWYSCQEEKQRNHKAEIIGFWEGTYSTIGRPDIEPQYINFLIKEDGTITNESSYMSEIRINYGTWELSGNMLKIQLSNIYGGEIPNPQTGTAELDPAGILKNGNIVNMSGSGSAQFEMIKRK